MPNNLLMVGDVVYAFTLNYSVFSDEIRYKEYEFGVVEKVKRVYCDVRTVDGKLESFPIDLSKQDPYSYGFTIPRCFSPAGGPVTYFSTSIKDGRAFSLDIIKKVREYFQDLADEMVDKAEKMRAPVAGLEGREE